MLARLEEMDRQVWEGHRLLEDITHVLGGAGVGLLIYSSVARWARPIGYILMGMSVLLHLYALMAMPMRLGAKQFRLRRAA